MAINLMNFRAFSLLALAVSVCGPAWSQDSRGAFGAYSYSPDWSTYGARGGAAYGANTQLDSYGRNFDPCGDRSAPDADAADAPDSDRSDVSGGLAENSGDQSSSSDHYGRHGCPADAERDRTEKLYDPYAAHAPNTNGPSGGYGEEFGANPLYPKATQNLEARRSNPYLDPSYSNPNAEDAFGSGAKPYDPSSAVNLTGARVNPYLDLPAKNPYASDALKAYGLNAGDERGSGADSYAPGSIPNETGSNMSSFDPAAGIPSALDALKPYGLTGDTEKKSGAIPSDSNSLLNPGGRHANPYADPAAASPVDPLNPYGVNRSAKGRSHANPYDPLSGSALSGADANPSADKR